MLSRVRSRGLGKTSVLLLFPVLAMLVSAGAAAPASPDERPKLPPFSASHFDVRTYLAPDLTREYQGLFESPGGTRAQTTLRVWSLDGRLLKEYKGDDGDWRMDPERALLVVRDRDRKVWHLESWLIGKKLDIPFDAASADNLWLTATGDLETVAVENSDSRPRTSLTFYVSGRRASSHDLQPTSWSHSEMAEDGYVGYLAGPRSPSDDVPAQLTLFDPLGRTRWRATLPAGEGRLGPGGFWVAERGQGILCADYVGGKRTFQLYDAEGKPRPAVRFAEATDFRTWVGDTTTALFESTREAERPGHTLTLADCAQGRILWQISQPDVDLSALTVVDDPTGSLGCQVILQAVHRTWEGGKREPFYPPFGFVGLRLLRADDGSLIAWYENPSTYVDNLPDRFCRRGKDMWLVNPGGPRKIDVALALSQAKAAPP